MQHSIAIVHRLLLVAVATAGMLASCPAARAQSPSDTDRETARQLMDQGTAAYRESKFDEALNAFEAADKLVRVTTTGLAVAKTLVQLGRLVEARGKLLQVARIPAQPGEPAALTNARREAAELQKQIAGRIGSIVLTIKGLESGAPLEVRLDGQTLPAGTLNLPRRVDPGTHRLEATAPGYQRQQLDVSVEEGEQKALRLDMVRSGEPVPSPGSPEPSGDGGMWTTSAWIGFGVAAGGSILGAITGGLSLSAASDAKDQCANDVCPRAAESDADRALALAHVSTISFIVAGLGAGWGITSLLLMGGDEEPNEAPAGTVQATVGPGWLGLSGRF